MHRLFRLFHTLRHIRFIQLYYQVWYRVKNRFLDIHWYSKYHAGRLVFFQTRVDRLLYVPESSAIAGKGFSFLGLSYSFEAKIDWNCSVHGKLWNYNLQYLNYLLDDRIPVEHRQALVLDISQALLSRTMALEPYPVSLRMVNTLIFLQRTGIMDARIEEALLRQVDYLDHNLEYHLLANHLLENIFSLFIAAQYLQDTVLLQRYERLLIKELNEQILADGGHYECTPMYQSILLSKLLLCIDVSIQSGQVSADAIEQLKGYASRMLGWVEAYSFPDGSWALFNDAAEGIAATTDQLRTAADQLGIKGHPQSLNASGFRKIGAGNWELLVKTGGVQPSYQPGHVHADIGSFCLWYKGQQYIVDPGISTYTVSAQRSWERSTPAHNTVSLNGKNQSDVWGGFRVGKRAGVTVNYATANSISLCIRGFDSKEVVIQRSFRGDSGVLEIIDSVDTKRLTTQAVSAQGSLLVHPAIAVEPGDSDIILGQVRIEMEAASYTIGAASMSSQYNRVQPTSNIVYAVDPTARIRFVFA